MIEFLSRLLRKGMLNLKTVYCDGSYHDKFQMMGVGIVSDSFNKYIEFPNFKTKTHEIEAIIHSIEISISQGLSNFTVVNDDFGLVDSINTMLDDNRVVYHKLYKKNRFSYLMKLLKSNNVKLRKPHSKKDLDFIRKSHNLSRSYLKKDDYNSYRYCSRMQVNFKAPDMLVKGDINRRNITEEKLNTMNMHYLALSKYDDRYTIDDVLKWIETMPSSNTKNGRKYAIAQFVKKFCK